MEGFVQTPETISHALGIWAKNFKHRNTFLQMIHTSMYSPSETYALLLSDDI